MPTTDAAVPTAAASRITERRTCLRVAPTARNNASSRVRCATMMEKVFQMMNDPTKTAIAAKTMRMTLTIWRPSLTTLAA